MESQVKHEWQQRRIFIVMSALFLIYWVMYLVHLLKTWPRIDLRLHLDSSSLATFSLALWVFLLKEKVSGWTMMFATFAFVAAVNLALQMF